VVSSTPRPHFSSRKERVPILQEAGWAPGQVWTGGKSLLHRNSIPDHPARSQLYRLSYPVHNNNINVDGNIYGNVNSDFNGDVNGNVNGDVNGKFNGNINGDVDGDVNCNVNGNVNGDVNGNFNGDNNGRFNGDNVKVNGNIGVLL